MVTLGTDAHKRSHTVVAVDAVGRQVGSVTAAATPEGHLRLVQWAAQYEQRRWAIEDCRALSRRLEADLLSVGEQVVRVPPKLMAGARRSVRQQGKSDPIDALSVARAALREPDLPMARLDGPSREIRLLVDYRESLVKDRTAAQNRLRWRLHELEPGYDPPSGALNRYQTLDAIDQLVAGHTSMVAELAKREVGRIRELTREANQLQRDITLRVAELAPSLLEIPGCGALSAAKLIGEAADITRFTSRDAYAMWAGTAPIPVWSAKPNRFRLNRGREPSNQRRTPPYRHHPTPDPSRRPSLHQTTPRVRFHQTRSPPASQTQTRQRRLPNPPRRHPKTCTRGRRLT